ncbi:MAG: T9SS type A sorting domain-containing protein [Chitinophagales bacterium]|nr:T9SS type A sorting domain-containing protein [Chitinophagales bacterium]
MRKRFLLSIFLINIFSLVFSQNTFQKIFTSDYDVECFGAYQETTGGYILTGIAQVSSTAYNTFMTRTNCHGEILWSKTYNTSSTIGNISQRVVETHDHGFLLAASIGSYNAYNILLVRTDANGNTIWQKTMQGSGDDLVNSVIETSSLDFILAGTTNTYGQDAGSVYKDVYLMKVDSSGNLLWGKTFGTADAFDEAFDVIETFDGHYAATGRYIVSEAFHCFLLKTDTAGNMIYMKAFGDTLQNATGYALANTLDGGYVITGSSTLAKESFLDFPDEFLIKTNADGDTLWCRSYRGSNIDGSENGSSVVALADGSYAIGVATFSYPSVGFVPNKHCVLKIDEEGNLEWLKAYNQGGSHYPYLTTAKGEPGYVLSGFTNFYVPHFSPMIIKLNDDFESGCNETDFTNLTFQEVLPAKVKTPAVIIDSGGVLTTTNVENDFILNDTVLCSNFSDSCFVFTTVKEIPNGSSIAIYPNPANDQALLEIISEKSQPAVIEIVDDMGKEIFKVEMKLSSRKNELRIDVSKFQDGVFLLRVRIKENNHVIKLVKSGLK